MSAWALKNPYSLKITQIHRKLKSDHTNSKTSQKPRSESDTGISHRGGGSLGVPPGYLGLFALSWLSHPFGNPASRLIPQGKSLPAPNVQQGFFTCVSDSSRLRGDVRFGLELDHFVLITCHNISPLSAILPAGLVLKEHMEAVAKHLIYKTCLYA